MRFILVGSVALAPTITAAGAMAALNGAMAAFDGAVAAFDGRAGGGLNSRLDDGTWEAETLVQQLL